MDIALKKGSLTKTRMINILVRNSLGRESLLKRCLTSIASQTYQQITIIISSDSPEVLKQTIQAIEAVEMNPNHKLKLIEVTPDTSKPFHWNLYCNTLKEQVTEGWFMYVDSDDFIHSPKALEILSKQLRNEKYGVMCRFLRNGRPKPVRSDRGKIIRGRIGGSCIVLHHKHKNLAHWQSCKAADYFFMKDIEKVLPLWWTDLVIVEAGNNGLKGKQP